MAVGPQVLALVSYIGLVLVAALSVLSWNLESLFPYRAAYNITTIEHLQSLEQIRAPLEIVIVVDGFPGNDVYENSSIHFEESPGLAERFLSCNEGCDFEEVLHERFPEVVGRLLVAVIPSENEKTVAPTVRFGQHRAAWVLTPSLKSLKDSKLLDALAEFLLSPPPPFGSREDLSQGTTGIRYCVSVTLVNADPAAWVVDWNGGAITSTLRSFLKPLTESQADAVVDVAIDSQVIHYGELPAEPNYQADIGAFTVPRKAMRRLLMVNDWKLSSAGDSRQTKILNFVVFVPSPRHCPLVLSDLASDSRNTPATAFAWPGWGGVALYCPSNATLVSPNIDTQATEIPYHQLRAEDLVVPLSQFAVQLRQLLGVTWSVSLPANWNYLGTVWEIPSWEVDLWHRHLTVLWAIEAQYTIVDYHELLAGMPSMPFATEAAQSLEVTAQAVIEVAESPFSAQNLRMAHDAVRQADEAFYNLTSWGQPYFPIEHRLAVFAPFFLPLAFTLASGVFFVARRRHQKTSAEAVSPPLEPSPQAVAAASSQAHRRD